MYSVFDLVSSASKSTKHKRRIAGKGGCGITRSHVAAEIGRGLWAAVHLARRARLEHGTHGGHDQPGDDVPQKRLSSRRQARQGLVRGRQESRALADWTRPRRQDCRPQPGHQGIPRKVLVAGDEHHRRTETSQHHRRRKGSAVRSKITASLFVRKKNIPSLRVCTGAQKMDTAPIYKRLDHFARFWYTTTPFF